MKYKDVKNVGNGLVAPKSSEHTDKSPRRINRWLRRLTF